MLVYCLNHVCCNVGTAGERLKVFICLQIKIPELFFISCAGKEQKKNVLYEQQVRV